MRGNRAFRPIRSNRGRALGDRPAVQDLKGHACTLLQIYFYRWQIEVNHREEKDTIGVGQA
jgi:hypothetical protein